MRLARLFRFCNPLFWIFVLLNGLSTVISYLLRTYEFPLPVVLVLVFFALGNLIYGIRIALRLMREPRYPETGDHGPQSRSWRGDPDSRRAITLTGVGTDRSGTDPDLFGDK